MDDERTDTHELPDPMGRSTAVELGRFGIAAVLGVGAALIAAPYVGGGWAAGLGFGSFFILLLASYLIPTRSSVRETADGELVGFPGRGWFSDDVHIPKGRGAVHILTTRRPNPNGADLRPWTVVHCEDGDWRFGVDSNFRPPFDDSCTVLWDQAGPDWRTWAAVQEICRLGGYGLTVAAEELGTIVSFDSDEVDTPLRHREAGPLLDAGAEDESSFEVEEFDDGGVELTWAGRDVIGPAIRTIFLALVFLALLIGVTATVGNFEDRSLRIMFLIGTGAMAFVLQSLWVRQTRLVFTAEPEGLTLWNRYAPGVERTREWDAEEARTVLWGCNWRGRLAVASKSDLGWSATQISPAEYREIRAHLISGLRGEGAANFDELPSVDPDELEGSESGWARVFARRSSER